MLNTLLPILLFAALGLAVLGALRRVAMWRQGRASRVDLIGGLFAIPKRYMVDLHHVVARDKYIANTHVATAGGAVAGAAIGANVGRGGGQVYSQDVQRCATVESQARPEYWDVTYNFRGVVHRAQMSAPPGRTLTVNGNGEPRG